MFIFTELAAHFELQPPSHLEENPSKCALRGNRGGAPPPTQEPGGGDLADESLQEEECGVVRLPEG